MTYQVTKTYGHELGLSACFRQWRATSHCRFLHGYALSFKMVFQAETLNECGWVIDFGSMKPIKQWLEATFDHKLVIAEDDPFGAALVCMANNLGPDPEADERLADALILPSVGCEAFAKLTFAQVQAWLLTIDQAQRVKLVSVEVREHGANSAIYMGE